MDDQEDQEDAALVLRLRAAGCVFAEDEARLLREAAAGDELERLVVRRVAGEPLEQVLGWVEFGGLRVAVEPGVFVPRQRTLFLVELAVAATPPGAVVVDAGCGSGALGLLLATRCPGVEVHAVDVDPAAVACARRNLAPVGGTAYAGDLLAPLPRGLRGRVAVLLANMPYVPTDAVALMPPESRDHEPRAAVDGGPDGLDLVRRVADQAVEWLAPGGRLYVEAGRAQAPAAAAAFEKCGLVATVERSDEHDATVVVGRR